MTSAELRVKIGMVLLECDGPGSAETVRHALAEVVAIYILAHCLQDGTAKQIRNSKAALMAQFVQDMGFALRELPKARERDKARTLQ